jgi:hypothetical protein
MYVHTYVRIMSRLNDHWSCEVNMRQCAVIPQGLSTGRKLYSLVLTFTLLYNHAIVLVCVHFQLLLLLLAFYVIVTTSLLLQLLLLLLLLLCAVLCTKPRTELTTALYTLLYTDCRLCAFFHDDNRARKPASESCSVRSCCCCCCWYTRSL